MASIQERTTKSGQKTYRVGYRYQGKLCWTHALDTPEAAVEIKDLFESRGVELARATIATMVGSTTAAATGAPTLSDALKTHLATVASYATPGTVEDYRRMAARTWEPHLGALPVDAIEDGHVTDWIAWQRRQETHRSVQARAKARREKRTEPAPVRVAPKSIVNAQGLLSDVLDYAVSKGHIGKNVAAGARMPDDAEPEEMVFLTPSEFAKLLAATPVHWQPLVTLLAATGMRWGEATALRPGDFDLDAKQPIVRVARAWKRGESGVYLGSPKSKKALRTITLPAGAVDAVRPRVEAAKDGDHVFRGVRGGLPHHSHFYERVWQPTVGRSGIDKSPRIHDLRHSHVSWLIAARVTLPVIQYRLGHESIQTTVDRYGHLAPDMHSGAAEATGEALAGALPQIEE